MIRPLNQSGGEYISNPSTNYVFLIKTEFRSLSMINLRPINANIETMTFVHRIVHYVLISSKMKIISSGAVLQNENKSELNG
jgi:hypothetical protein